MASCIRQNNLMDKNTELMRVMAAIAPQQKTETQHFYVFAVWVNQEDIYSYVLLLSVNYFREKKAS